MPDATPITADMLITFAVLIGVLVLFVRDALPPHLTALAAMAVLLAAGVIDTSAALSVFSNSAPITIACMCVMSAALEHTGVVDLVGRAILSTADRNRTLAVIALLAGVMLVSAFMNNTPVVIVMAPVVIAVAKRLQSSPSKYLIPLSYAAILGGTCTLIGTSTNILTDGVATANGLAPFSMFEITGPGVAMAAVGAAFLALLGPKLLPDRPLLQAEILADAPSRHFLAEAVVPPDSPLIGRTLNEVRFSDGADYEILDLIRNEAGARNGLANLMRAVRDLRGGSSEPQPKPRSTLRDIPLQAGDRLVFKTSKEELLEIRDTAGISFDTETGPVTYKPLLTRETTVTEGAIGPNSRFIGQSPSDLRLRRRYDSYVVAVHRDQRNITANFESYRLRYGDLLLLEGPQEELDRLFAQENILPVSQVQYRPIHRFKAFAAVAAIVGVVGLAAVNAMPIAGLAIPGAVFVILAGCIDLEKAYEAVEWRILMLIFGMLALSQALDSTGAARLIVETFANLVQDFGPIAILATVYMITSLFTEVMSNNATAVLMTPIAIGVAQHAGIDPRPLVVAVMLGASASFATPIGYQTNTYVYNIGNYRFTDFLRIGVPMNLLMLVVATVVIPWFWPF